MWRLSGQTASKERCGLLDAALPMMLIQVSGGIDCPANSAVHLGWVGEREVRLGHYYNDSTLNEVPAFRRNNYPISLVVGRAGAIGKQVALLVATFDFSTRSLTYVL